MANIELPEDAEGREIPLDTKVLYGRYGFKNNVKPFMYVVNTTTCTGTRRVKFTIGTSLFAVSDMHLAEPDSREKSDEDLHAVGVCGDSPDLEDPVCVPMHTIAVRSASNASSTQGIALSICAKTSPAVSVN